MRTISFPFIVFALLGLFSEPAQPLLAQATVAINGRVYDVETNAPLGGVQVSTQLNPVGSRFPVGVLTRSQADGTFTLQVAPGKHVLCADAGKAYLDICQWSPGATTTDTAVSNRLDLPLRKGVLLVVQVHDPGGAADHVRNSVAALARFPGPQVALTITDSQGKARPLPFIHSSGPTSEFSATVPPDTTFALEGQSSLLVLADEGGNRLPQNLFRNSVITPSSIPRPTINWQFSKTPAIPTLTVHLGISGALVP